jgi:hypothetical protein
MSRKDKEVFFVLVKFLIVRRVRTTMNDHAENGKKAKSRAPLRRIKAKG